MFKSARLKLTLSYLAIIMSVSIMFSLVIYRAVSLEVERFEVMQRVRFERQLVGRPPRVLFQRNPELLKEAKTRIQIILLLINSSILVISGALGYWLAGRTLNPIQVMVDEQNRFITDASHELKTPLTSLKAAFEVYLRGKSKTAKEAETIITESLLEVDKLQELSESLLRLAQYQKPNKHWHWGAVSLLAVAQQAVKKIQPQAKLKQIKLSVTGDDLKVVGNAHSLGDLITILLDNAIKYSPAKKTVAIKITKKEKQALLTIQDQGIGINKEDLSHIFERFYQADSARSQSGQKGFGLGLSIAAEIVKSHHGQIKVKSVPNEGTEFLVFLPFFS